MPYARPGTYVNEVLLREQPPVNASTAVAAFVGTSRRGPVTPTLFTGWTEFTRLFGSFTGVADDDVLVQAVYDFFINGGRTVVVSRAVGAGAEPAALTLNVTGTDGTPGSGALRVAASSPGSWGDEVYVEVLPGSAEDRFSLVVRRVPAGTTTMTNQQIVERWSDLSLNPRDGRYALGIVNNLSTGSAYLQVADAEGFTYTDGATLAASTTPGGNPLAGGGDGAQLGSDDYLAAVYRLDELAVPFVLNLPGVTDTATIAAVANYADADRLREDNNEPGRGDVFVVVDSVPGSSVDAAIELAASYPNSDYLAAYYPRLIVPDPAALVPGATKTVPAGPSVVGRYIATDAARGPFKAPAGVVDGALAGVAAIEPVRLRNPELDRLNNANINAIRLLPGRGPTVFGARTRRRDFVTRYVPARRTIIKARADLLAALAFVPFENNDSTLWSSMANAADKVLRTLFAAGGLRGDTPDQAYYVRCDSATNTLATIAAGEVHLEVGLALQRPAEFVVLTIAQFESGATVRESSVPGLRTDDF